MLSDRWGVLEILVGESNADLGALRRCGEVYAAVVRNLLGKISCSPIDWT